MLTRRGVLAGTLPALAGCGSKPANDGWEAGPAEQAGFDANALRQLSADLDAGRFPKTHSVLVEQGGRIVYERYFAGEDQRWIQPMGYRVMDADSLHDLRSVSKSVTSAVLGIAIGKDFDTMLARPIMSFFPRLPARPDLHELTLHHCLTMAAGLEWNEMAVPYAAQDNDELRMYASKDPVALVLTRPLREGPGAVWYYNGGLTQVLAGVVANLTGKPLDAYANEVLFKPLGIEKYEWPGVPDWNPPMPAAASGLRLRTRDLAKFGSVYLHGGQWQGKQIVPAEWVKRSTQRHVQSIGAWSRNGIFGYGYQWWIGKFPDGLEVAAGVGNGNQRVFVAPQEDMVVTIFAGDYNAFEGHSERLLRRIVAARRQSA